MELKRKILVSTQVNTKGLSGFCKKKEIQISITLNERRWLFQPLVVEEGYLRPIVFLWLCNYNILFLLLRISTVLAVTY